MERTICRASPLPSIKNTKNHSGFPDSQPLKAFVILLSEVFSFRHTRHHFAFLRAPKDGWPKKSEHQTISKESFLEYPISDCGRLPEKILY